MRRASDACAARGYTLSVMPFVPTRLLLPTVLAIAAATPVSHPAVAAPASTRSVFDNDEQLLNALSDRGLGSLMERAFEVCNTPPAQREARRAVLALQQLSTDAAGMSARQRQELVDRITRAAGAAVAGGGGDPEALMQQARVLLEVAADRHVNTLELWGDSATARAALRPVAETVVRLYDRAAESAGAIVEQIGNQTTLTASDERRLDRMFQLAQLAAFNARMSDYAVVIALDPADPNRRTVAERAIAALSELDAPDQPIRSAVRLRLAKLELARGNLDAARKLLDAVVAATDPPPPTPLEQFQARYFRTAVELQARQPVEAQKQLEALTAWYPTTLAGADSGTRDLASASAAMLQYRIHELRAATAGSETDRRAANQSAVDTLANLLKEQPQLQGVIGDLLISRLPDDAPLAPLDTLVLQSIVRRGEEQRLRPDPSQRDARQIRRAVQAAEEILARPGVDATLADNCRFVLPFLRESLGDQAAAAAGFLDYAESSLPPGERGSAALGQAQAMVAALRRVDGQDANTVALYERFLRVAVELYDRREFAYEYARRLQLLDRPAEAIRWFDAVPADDPRAAAARFFQMLAVKQQLDELPAGQADARGALLGRIQQLADAVTAAAGDAPPERREAMDAMLVRTKLLAADLARAEQKDPRRALALLADVEPALARLPGGEALLPEVLLIRVQSHMAVGESDRATSALVQLLGQRDGGQGAAIVYSLLEKLNEELDDARAAGDSARMAQVAQNRAELSGFLVAWARDHADPKIRQYAYRYAVFDAASKQLAADLAADAGARRSGREAALALYRTLESPEQFRQYLQTLPDPRAAATAEYDPAVNFGIARLCYDLGELAEARDRLARLLNDRKLGTPVLVSVEPDGSTRETDNDQYWEAVLKFLRANLSLGQNVDASRVYLREQQVKWGSRVGGRRWKSDFAALSTELGVPPPPGADPPTSAPTISG